jgi:hypothetical protein
VNCEKYIFSIRSFTDSKLNVKTKVELRLYLDPWSLSLPKRIKKATSPFYAALFAREEAAWRELRCVPFGKLRDQEISVNHL